MLEQGPFGLRAGSHRLAMPPPPNVRRSVRTPGETAVLASAAKAAVESEELKPEFQYRKIIEESRASLDTKDFLEEWDAQLLVDCGYTPAGHRLVIFTPVFLSPIIDNPEEMDRAFRFILLTMHDIAMKEKYVFVYCCLGLDWQSPQLIERLRVAYDILPSKYAKHLQRFYVLHPTAGFRFTVMTFWPWLSPRFWDKIEYLNGLEILGEKLEFASDGAALAEFRRHFPQVVQRRDAEEIGVRAPVTFGASLRHMSATVGIDFLDKTTGRWYPRLPPALVFICEKMEREAAFEEFGLMFTAGAEDTYDIVDTLDSGTPLGNDTPSSVLWTALKLFIDCLPVPFFGFDAMEELQRRGIDPAPVVQRQFLVDILHKGIHQEACYAALYLASFLHTMCSNAQAHLLAKQEDPPAQGMFITPELAAQAFTAGFFRPKQVTAETMRWMPSATNVVETLIRNAEEEDLWREPPAGPRSRRHSLLMANKDSSSEED